MTGFSSLSSLSVVYCRDLTALRTLFFLFYFNRVFATLVSYGLRAWTWHRYRVYIDIQALQISLLGGRVFFKGFRYHGNNETIFIQSGFVTWCYWLRNVRQLSLGQSQNVTQERDSTDSERGETRPPETLTKERTKSSRHQELPCRLQVSLKGVEWFVYNKSAAYDAIVAGLTTGNDEIVEVGVVSESVENVKGQPRRRGKPRTSFGDIPFSETADLDSESYTPTEKVHAESRPADRISRRSSSDFQAEGSIGRRDLGDGAGDAFVLRFLPIYIECEKAAIVLGNENTKTVLITKADKARGVIDASNSSTLDQYRQLINFEFEHPVIQMKPNDDYKEDQVSVASRIKCGAGDLQSEKIEHLHNHSFVHRQRRKVWHKLQYFVPAFRRSVESLSSTLNGSPETHPQVQTQASSWQGLSRYLDESEQDDKARWSSIEYATVSTIVDSSFASMTFYWDVVGTVQGRTEHRRGDQEKVIGNINGDEPPGWGIDLSLKGGTINYGPWADRQRADIQRVFFPSLCKDSTPSQRLVPGQFRVPTDFKLLIEFDEETTLRLPIKEESKNWKWTKQADAMAARSSDRKRPGKSNRKRKADKGNIGPEVRPFGWLDVKVGANAVVKYQMDMVAGQSGFSNKLELDLPSMEITSSVNHGLLWRSINNHISCDLSSPLQWNGHRTWIFDVKSDNLELFILREHIFLLIDLVDDWGSGPPPEYLTFTPFHYMVNFHLNNFKIYLNVNDSNIINNPSDFDDNTFIVIFGSILTADVCIPLENYRPHRNDISFHVAIKHGGLNLHVPPWNTQATFLTSTELATLTDLSVAGKYQYCSTTATSNTDTLLIDAHVQATSAVFYGFVVRYLLKVKDNYFGDDIRFKTLEEYQDLLRASQEEDSGAITNPLPPHKKSNDLDVILTVSANDSSVIVPANLYSAKNHTRIEIAHISADLRFTNYFMDLDIVLSPLAFSQVSKSEGSTTPTSSSSGTQLYVDGVNVSGNRLFGLPPTEPTYVCNWDFSIGAVTGECTIDFLTRLINGGRAFAFSFDDDENALDSISAEILHDVTFLRASILSVRLWLHVEDVAFLLSTGSVSLKFDDWASSHFSKKLKLLVPKFHVGCVDAESASRHRSRSHHPVDTYALLQTTISISMTQRKLGFAKERQLQQEHIKRQDQRTRRAEFLLYHRFHDNFIESAVDAPAMSPPPMPPPVLSVSNISGERSINSSRGTGRADRKSSFLSSKSSIYKSDNGHVLSQGRSRDSTLEGRDRLSRGFQAGTVGLDRRTAIRDLSVSTGRQSSFYSVAVDHRALPPSAITISSSYIAPYFPLEEIEPDPKHLPEILYTPKTTPLSTEKELGLNDVSADKLAEDCTYTSFVVDFPTGICCFFNPEAAYAVANLLTATQARDPADILDEMQINSMNEIFELRRHKTLKATVLDVKICAPSIGLRFISTSDVMNMAARPRQIHDQYDFSVSMLSATLRSGTTAAAVTTTEDVKTNHTLHISLVSASAIAKERQSDIADSQAAITCILEGFVAWASSRDEVVANVSLQDFHLLTSGSKIEYLASLIHRTQTVINNLVEAFSCIDKQQRRRVQIFMYLVATAGQKTNDPLFLTRPSYVLRSATGHLRTSDSWKIITRLHHMFCSLDSSAQRDISAFCFNNTHDLPNNAQQLVVAGFDQWRSWDLNSIDSCPVMEKVYGQKADLGTRPQRQRPLKLSTHAENIRFVVDPGPKQNEITVFDVTLFLDNNIASSTEEIGPQTEVQVVETTVAQAFLKEIIIHFNWELCTLAEDILQLYQNDLSQSETQVNKFSDSAIHERRPRTAHELQVVVATEQASIAIDTINIGLILCSKGLKASLTASDQDHDDSDKIATLVLTADSASVKLKSHSQHLSIIQLEFPSIYTSSQQQLSRQDQTTVLRVAGNCQRLSFDVKQDILALFEVFDLFVGDEIASLYRLKQLSLGHASMPLRTVPSLTPKPKFNINITLFLDLYDISIPLMQSLRYKISGVVARASITAQMDNEIVLDFDIKENSHDIQTFSGNRSTSISFLELPSTNGRITSYSIGKESILSIFASVEPIKLDAAAVHNLLVALNRPEISIVVADVREDINSIQAHLSEIFGPAKHEPKLSKLQARPFIYEAHLTLAGFDLFANAQGPHTDHKTARLDFNVGCVQLVVTNRLEPGGAVLQSPDVRMVVRHVWLELSRWTNDVLEPCGNLSSMAHLRITSRLDERGKDVKYCHVRSDGLNINLFADTASSIVDVLGHLQSKIKDLDLSREKSYFRKLRRTKPQIAINVETENSQDSLSSTTTVFESMYSLELLNIQIRWLLGTYQTDSPSSRKNENLGLSLKRVDLSTRKQNSARLTIEELQLQIESAMSDINQRSPNSALLPEVIFNVGYVSNTESRRLAFQAAGKSLDLRLTSQFMIPASKLQKSIGSAMERVHAASATWTSVDTSSVQSRRRQPFFGKKRMESLLVDADFAGAVVYLSGDNVLDKTSSGIRAGKAAQLGKYGQFTQRDSSSSTVLRAPGLAWKIEYIDNATDDPSLNAEVKLHASSNILYPSVVPLIMDISSTVKEIVSDEGEEKVQEPKSSPQKFMAVDETNILTTDPTTVLGRTKLNLGIRICKQEFSLSCQPIARVAATARFESIYLTVNTVRSTEHGHFFTASAAITKLQASVQHVYSRESTGSFDVDSVFLSLMNSKHVSGTSGLSAILNISPMKVLINAKQLQDFLLFREIWVPHEIRQSSPHPTSSTSNVQSQPFLVQRYQQVAVTGAFPWNATVSIAELDMQIDLGQAIGKSAFMISNCWISSKKNSDWEQNLCMGFDKVGIDSTGRMSGFVSLQDFKLRTSIQWPALGIALNQTPLVQGSLSFSQLRLKAAFDYQAFVVADITSVEFLMYNVRNGTSAKANRLVAILDGQAVQAFCTTTTASQSLALYQAFQRLIQEKRANYEASLTEIEKFMQRKSASLSASSPSKQSLETLQAKKPPEPMLSLHTDVIVTLKAVNVGAFPNTFTDNQVFKLEALNAQARFAVTMDGGQTHSSLGLTLGQLRIGLASVKQVDVPKSVVEVSVEDVIKNATGSRGGTILKVPKVEAIMQTWHAPESTHIDYIFKSSFEGKVEVGWNYSRISYLRNMWALHSKALAQRLGKPLPPSAVKITGVPDGAQDDRRVGEQRKITAEVKMPQSKYDYTALEEPIIETPQLRDMGEATPP